MKLELVTQKIRQRHGHGVDWGVIGKILVHDPEQKRSLIWSPGHSQCLQARGFGATYIPSNLVLHDGKSRNILGKELFSGGRLSRKALFRFVNEIDDFFGHSGVTAMIDVHRTVEISR